MCRIMWAVFSFTNRDTLDSVIRSFVWKCSICRYLTDLKVKLEYGVGGFVWGGVGWGEVGWDGMG